MHRPRLASSSWIWGILSLLRVSQRPDQSNHIQRHHPHAAVPTSLLPPVALVDESVNRLDCDNDTRMTGESRDALECRHCPMTVVPHTHLVPAGSAGGLLWTRASRAWTLSDGRVFLPWGTFPASVLLPILPGALPVPPGGTTSAHHPQIQSCSNGRSGW